MTEVVEGILAPRLSRLQIGTGPLMARAWRDRLRLVHISLKSSARVHIPLDLTAPRYGIFLFLLVRVRTDFTARGSRS